MSLQELILFAPMTVKLCLVTETHRETQTDKVLRTREASTELDGISERKFTLQGKKLTHVRNQTHINRLFHMFLQHGIAPDSLFSTIIFHLRSTPVSNCSTYIICLGKLFYHIAPSYPTCTFPPQKKKVICPFNVFGFNCSIILCFFTEEKN